jgi:uncharacterized phage protein (TIGR01671 family)
MREIVFRGKRVDNGEWVYGNLLHFEEAFATWQDIIVASDAALYTKGEEENDMGIETGGWYRVDPATVGQWTERMSTTGKRIFDGDKVAYHRMLRGKRVDYVGVVSWDKHSICWRVKPNNTIFLDNALLSMIDDVVGNIHDQPEAGR